MWNLCLAFILFCGIGLAQPALVTSAGSDTNDTTGTPVTTTGANLITGNVSTQDASPNMTDSKGNTYTLYLTTTNDGVNKVFFFYCLSPVVGSGHTFATSATSGSHSIVVGAYSGVQGLDTGITSVSTTCGGSTFTCQPGSITPSVNGDLLVVAAASGSGAYPDTITSPFTPVYFAFVNGNGQAYYVQPTAAAINPTITYVVGGSSITATIAAFTPIVSSSSTRHRAISQ